MQKKNTKPNIVNTTTKGILSFLLVCLFTWPVQSETPENLDIDVISGVYNDQRVWLEVEYECPAIVNIRPMTWLSTSHYVKWFNVYISIDGGPEILIFEHENSTPNVVGEWWATTPNSTLLGYGLWTGGHVGWHYHDAYVQIPSGKNVTFRTEGMLSVNGTDTPDNYLNNTGTYQFPAPGAPDGFSLSQNCTSNTLTWSAPTALPSCSGSLKYEIYRRDSGSGSYTFLASTSSTSFSDDSPSGDDSYKVRARYTPEVPFSFTMPEGYEANLGGANTSTRWPSYSVFSNALDAESLVPSKPTDVTSSTTRCGEIKVDWSYSGSTDAFEIWRSTNNVNFTKVGEAGGAMRSYYDDPPNPQHPTTYYYKVSAMNSGCPGAASNVTLGHVKGEPTAPTSINSISVNNGAAIRVNWNNPSAAPVEKFIVERSGGGGTITFEVDGSTLKYDDADALQCNTYTYRVRSMNSCGDNLSSVSTQMRLDPDIGNAFTATKFLNASKGYYNDRIALKWNNEYSGQIQRFKIYRKPHDEAEYSLLTTIDPTSSYIDYTAEAGIYYEYFIQGEADCEDDVIVTNKNAFSIDYGFRVPAATVSGTVTFEGGAGVTGVSILAETDDEFSGNALAFDGIDDQLIIPDNNFSKFDFEQAFAFQAWIKPASAGSSTVFQKGNQYKLTQSPGQLTFYANGQHLTMDFTQKPDTFFCVNAIRSADSLLLYVLYNELEYEKTGMPFSGTTAANNDDIYVGSAASGSFFHGTIEEMRFWQKSLNETEVINSSIRYIAGSESGLAAYYRLNESFADKVYDISRSGSAFNENHGLLSGGPQITPDIPFTRQLTVKGITDQSGNYLITGIPYTAGSVYRFTPIFEVHEFDPHQRQIYIGPGSDVHSGVDFLDIAAFRITGNIVYDDTYFPVKGVNFYIDGQIVMNANGVPIESDEFGNYEIYVPIGWHFFEVRKHGHTFAHGGRFPLEGNFNFQQHISGVDFTDVTRIKLIGRVSGGSVEEAKKAGLGLTNNNLGHAHMKLTTQKGYDLTREGTSGTWQQLIYRDDVEESVGETEYSIAPLAPKSINIYPDTKTGEFVVYLLPEKYVISSVTAGDYIYPGSFLTVLDLSNAHIEHTEVDSVLVDMAYDVNGNEIYYYRIDSINYNHNHPLIYRVTPSIDVTDQAGEMAFWEREIDVEGVDVTVVNSDGSLRTPYPLFVQRKPYHLKIRVFERYINADENNAEDWVPVTDGLLEIQNGLAIQKDKFNLAIDSTGTANYSFVGGLPNITTGGIGDYLKSFSMVARTGPNHSINTPWLPNNGSPFYGYVLGGMPSGNNFVTTGPNEVVMILRDPPGSGSYSYFEQGSEFSISKSTEVEHTETTNTNVTVDLGSRVVTFAGLGAGVITETENIFDASVGLERSTTYVDNTTTSTTLSNTQVWSTSDDPYFNGTNGDIFIGFSTNIVYGVSTQIKLLPSDMGEGHIGEEFIHNGLTYDIGVTNGLRMDTEFNTAFIFTQDHIKNSLIPNLQMMRNNFLINNPDVYQCVICDQESEEFGRDNQTGLKTESGYIGGDSYNIFIPLDWPDDELFEDSVAYFNKQIAGWEDWLRHNEKEKLLGTVEKNISFDAGSIYESSTSNSSATEHESTFSFNISPTVATTMGFEIMSMGTTFEMSQSYSYTETTTEGISSASTQNYGYVLADGDAGDYLSVDVLKPQTATGPVFRTMGGQTSCPYQDASYTEYFQPGALLNQATMQREKPQITCENPIQNDVLENKAAIFNVQMQNISETGDAAWFILTVDDESNQHGALVEMDGSAIGNGRLIAIPAGETVNKTITIRKTQEGVYEYENIKLVLGSQCDDEIYAEQEITARFQPVCTPVNLVSPLDQWIINTNGDTTLLVNIDGYDLNHPSFQNLVFQYKPASSPTWTTGMNYFMYEEDYDQASGPKEMIDGRANLTYDFQMDAMQDRNYDVRLRTTCADGTWNESVLASGIKDVKRPRVFGSPQPASGILTPNDDIMVTFDEPLQTGMLTPYNFSVRGVLNGQELKHQTCIYFDGAASYLTSLNGVNVNDKPFTISFWVRRGDNQPGVILAQNGMEIGFNASNKFYFKGGNQTITSSNAYTDTETWYHFAITYHAGNNKYAMYVNDVIESEGIAKTSNFDSSGKMYIGRDISGGNHFNGYLHEFRVWEEYMGLGGVYALMYQSLAGNEIGLSGYWPMDEAAGSITEDLARGNHAFFFDAQWRVFPAGYNREFNGISDFVKINTGSEVVVDHDMNFTLEFFFKATPQQNTVLFSNGNANGTDMTPTLANIWNIGFNDNGHLYVLNNGTIMTLENLELTDDQWYHFSLIVNRRANASVFIDGNMVDYRQASLFGGMVGADMVLGARRNQPGSDQESVYYDQHFVGKIDELRIWGLSRTLKQVQMDMHCALHGDEMGLMAYYPFDEYDHLGVYRNPSLADLTDLTGERMAVAEGNTSNVDVPNIKDARPVQNLTFEWVASNDKIIININEPPAAIERSIVEFTVDRVEDLHENRVASPVTWTAFIKQNTVIWDADYMTFEKELYAPLSFQVDILNTGGTEENYTISNLPAWITCDDPSGTLTPLSSKTITFTVNEALNTGRYEVSIYLTSDFGFSEKLELKLKVFKPAPLWSVDASEYQYSMNVIGQLFIDSIVSTDEDDMIAAFVGDQCRGVVNMKYVMQQDNYLAFLDVYSNSEQGEEVFLKVWDASEGQIITNVIPDLVFEQNGIYGSPAQSLKIYASTIYEGHVELNSGWNWVSFNLQSENLNNLSVLLKDVQLYDNAIIKGQFGFDVYSAQTQSWFGNLTENTGIDNKQMYMIKTMQADTIIYEGKAADVDDPLSLVPGWNWIGYTPQVALEITESFASLNPVTGDFVKSQTRFSMFDNNLGWVGSLRMLRPGTGYMFKSINHAQFTYPENSIMSKDIKEETMIEHPWYVYSHNNPHNMSVVARISDHPIQSNENYVLGSFTGDICRGVAQPVEVENNFLFFINISAEEQQEIDFKLYDKDKQTIIPLAESISFEKQRIMGDIYDPLLLTISGNGTNVAESHWSQATFYPNPFDERIIIEFEKPLEENALVEIIDITGKRVFTFEPETIKGKKQLVWHGETTLSNKADTGVYFFRIADKNINKIFKIIRSEN